MQGEGPNWFHGPKGFQAAGKSPETSRYAAYRRSSFSNLVENKKAVKQVFDSFDQDKNGTLSLDEFKKFLHVLQNSETTFLDLSKIPTSDFDLFAQTLFDKVDLQHGNKIIFDDFVSFLKNPPTISASDLCPQQDIKPEAKPEAKPEIKQKRKLLAFSSLEESDIKVTETKLNTKLWHQWGDCVLATLDDKPVFIKKIYHPKDHGQNLDTFQRDIEIMAQLPSAFFEKIYGFCLSEAFVVSEYFPTGSLQDLFEASTGPCFEWKPAIRFLQAVAQGISTLHHHDPPLLHLELKPSRILLTQDKQPRLCALDMSRFSNRLVCQKPAKHMIHTPPEVLAGNECSPASDIYSFGPLVLQLVQG